MGAYIMINFILLTVVGVLAVIIITAILSWVMDNSTKLDEKEEDRLTDLYRDR